MPFGQAQIGIPAVLFESHRMEKPKYKPVLLTAFGGKAHLVLQVAAEQGVLYDETPVPGKDQIAFSFKKLDRAGADKLVMAMPTEVFAKRGFFVGSGPQLDLTKKD